MRDPHTHAPKDVVFTHGVVRDVIARATGRIVASPKTVATACGRRRPYASTSPDPVAVTCLACRENAAEQHHQRAGQASAALDVLVGDSRSRTIRTPTGPVVQTVTRQGLIDSRDEHLDLAEAFRELP